MRKLRFFVPVEKVRGNQVIIDGQEFKHLHKVLRQKEGCFVTIICNDNKIRKCKIVKITKDYAIAEILEEKQQESFGADITVFLALIKSDPLSNAVQKCTELGVKKFVPFLSEFGVIEDRGQIKPRLLRIGESSCKQCGRLSNIEVTDALTFDQMCEELANYDDVLVAYEKEKMDAKKVVSKLNKNSKIAVVVGSEGGFSENEVQKLFNLKNAHFLSLGKLILRADTAVFALVSAIKYELGDFTNENSDADLGM